MSKIMQVFYGTDLLPYKDQARSVHYPIVGNAFLGASNTTEIRFYIDQIGNYEDTWVANSKFPNGKMGNEILTSGFDEELNEHYVKMTLSTFYTQAIGNLFISLNGFIGGVQIVEQEGIYTIQGTPTIQATGSVKIAINYATPLANGDELSQITLQQILSEIATKLPKNSSYIFKAISSIDNINTSPSDEYFVSGDIVIDTTTKRVYKLSGTYPSLVATEIELDLNDLSLRGNLQVQNFANILNGSNTPLTTYVSNEISTAITNEHNLLIPIIDGYAKSLQVSIDSSTYVMTLVLKAGNGSTLSTQTVDLPLETMVVGGSYDDTTEELVLLLNNGNEIRIPVSDLVSGLVSETDLQTALSNYFTKSEINAKLDVINEELDTKLESSDLKTLNNVSLVGSGNISYDTTLSTTSTNAVQNKIITSLVNELNYELAVIRESLYDSVLSEIDYETEFAQFYVMPNTLTDTDGTHRVVFSATQLKEVEGNSLVYNQFSYEITNDGKWVGNGAYGTSVYGYNKITYTITIKNGSQAVFLREPYTQKIPNGHSVFIKFDIKLTSQRVVYCDCYNLGFTITSFGSVEANKLTSLYKIITTAQQSSPGGFYIYPALSVGLEVGEVMELSNVAIIDLTQMFNGNIPQEVLDDPTKIYKYCPIINVYSTGDIFNSTVGRLDFRGFNQWDEETELGSYNTVTGEKVSDSSKIRNKNPILVIPNTQYAKYSSNNSVYWLIFYDSNMNYIERQGVNFGLNTFITPSNAKYMNLLFETAYGTTYNHDICINISNASFNGNYKPYSYSVMNLPQVELLSAGTAHDNIQIVEGDIVNGEQLYNIVKNVYVGSVNLGSLNWSTTSNDLFESSDVPNIKQATYSSTLNYSCSIYQAKEPNVAWANMLNMTIGQNTAKLRAKNTTYTDAATFKSAMNGVILNYELATPTQTVLLTGLHFNQVSALIEQCGTIEVKQLGTPANITTTYVVKKALEE